MMRSGFMRMMEDLFSELTMMGALVEHAIDRAAEALADMDKEKAIAAIEFDKEIDLKEKEIEGLCMKLLLHQQPVAKDLRLVSTALHMIRDMERIGDQAADIAELTMHMDAGTEPFAAARHLPLMAQSVQQMVKSSIDAFVKSDVELAEKTIADDDNIDTMFLETRDEMVKLISSKPEAANAAVDILMTAKYFERIGDHAENIAEWAEYSVTGRHRGEKQ